MGAVTAERLAGLGATVVVLARRKERLDSLVKNIETHYYESGHMVYAHLDSLKQLHDNVAAFIDKTDNVGGAK